MSSHHTWFRTIYPFIHPPIYHSPFNPFIFVATCACMYPSIYVHSPIHHLSIHMHHPSFDACMHLSLSIIHVCTHLFSHPPIHLSIHASIHPCMNPSIMYVFTHLFIHQSVSSYIHISFPPCIYPCIHSSTHPLIQDNVLSTTTKGLLEEDIFLPSLWKRPDGFSYAISMLLQWPLKEYETSLRQVQLREVSSWTTEGKGVDLLGSPLQRELPSSLWKLCPT